MIDGTYEVEFNTPLGRKTGTVTLACEGSSVVADLKAPLVGRQRLTGTSNGDSFSAQGTIKVKLIGSIDYALEGAVVDDVLVVNIHSGKGDLELVGTRVA